MSPATIDFTRGAWGHTLHVDTWREEFAPGWFQRWRDRRNGVRRYSVMVHCFFFPEPGQWIAYHTDRGERNAKIVRAEPCGDPDDMFTLHLIVYNKVIQ